MTETAAHAETAVRASTGRTIARLWLDAVGEGRDRKIRIFKYKKRKHYRRTKGHRQAYTALRIDAIEL